MAFKEKQDAIKYNNQYNKDKYDRVSLMLKKEQKKVLQAAAAAQGESVNAYIQKAIEQRMEREGGSFSISAPASGDKQ